LELQVRTARFCQSSCFPGNIKCGVVHRASGLRHLMEQAQPAEVYNLMAQSYTADASEMFEAAPPPQTESTLFCPNSASKVHAHWHASNAFLLNHESKCRGLRTAPSSGFSNQLFFGNLEARRDRGLLQATRFGRRMRWIGWDEVCGRGDPSKIEPALVIGL